MANAMKAIEEFLKAVDKSKVFGCDFEVLNVQDSKGRNTPAKMRPIGVCVGIPTSNQQREKLWYFSFDKYYSEENVIPMTTFFGLVSNVLKSPEIVQIAHNAKFESNIYYHCGVECNNHWWDSMVADWVFRPWKKRYALKSTIKEEFGHEMVEFKDTVMGDGLFSIEPLAEYCKDDVRQSMRLMMKRKRQLEQSGLWQVFDRIEMQCVRALGTIEYHGMYFDIEKAKKLLDWINTYTADIRDKIFKIVGRPFDINSSEQLSLILFEEMGLPLRDILFFEDYDTETKKMQRKYVTKKGHYSVDKDVLNWYSDYEIVKLISEYRTYDKWRDTFLEKFIRDAEASSDGRLRCRMNHTGTRSGRLSSSKPNLQNIPGDSRMRELFCVPEGRKMVAADYKALELRLIAHFGRSVLGKSAFGDAFDAGIDPHEHTAKLMSTLLGREVPRKEGKICNFAYSYGRGADSTAISYKIPIGEAKTQRNAFLNTHPEVMGGISVAEQRLRDTGYVESFFGFRREFRNCKGRTKIGWDAKIAFNHIIQSTGGQIGKLGLAFAYRALLNAGLNNPIPIEQTHDEIGFEVDESEAEKAAKIIKKAMESVTTALLFPLEVDVKIGDNWAAVH